MTHAHLEIGATKQIGDNVQGTVAADAAAVSLATLNKGGMSSKLALVQIVQRGGTSNVTLPAPVRLVGPCLGRRVVLGQLNGGASIVVGADGGYQELVQGIGLCSALVLIPGGALDGTGTPPIDVFVTAVWGSP